jgi:hypothetical protein
MVLVEPAFLFKGILKLSESDFQQKHFFDSSKSDFKLMKFVPASGAATECSNSYVISG